MHCVPPDWIWGQRTAAAWLYRAGIWGNLGIWDAPKSGEKEKSSEYWKPADLACLSMDIWLWTVTIKASLAAREGEWRQLSPFKTTGTKETTHILNFSSCPTPRTGPFKHHSAVLSQLNFWAKCSNSSVVTSCSPKTYLTNIGLRDPKTPVIEAYKLLRNRDSPSLNYTV